MACQRKQQQMTYPSAAEAEADRAQQKLMLAVLNAWNRALRRDECGAWCISGTRGTLHTWGDGKGWALYVSCNSGQHWTWVKKLSFCTVSQEGDDEGVLKLDQLPTPEQADAIRSALGIQKHREISAEVLARLKTFAFDRKPRSGASVEPNIGRSGLPQSDTPFQDQTPILDVTPSSAALPLRDWQAR
jgi:hypothetical protein